MVYGGLSDPAGGCRFASGIFLLNNKTGSAFALPVFCYLGILKNMFIKETAFTKKIGILSLTEIYRFLFFSDDPRRGL